MLSKREYEESNGKNSTQAKTLTNNGNNWWMNQNEDIKEDKKEKWTAMEHNGVYFPENYIKQNIDVLYDNKKVKLSTFQEELATYWTQTLGTDWLKNPYYKINFVKLFLETFKKRPLKFLNKNKKTLEMIDFESGPNVGDIPFDGKILFN